MQHRGRRLFWFIGDSIEPEVGATVQVLDAADNVSWRATGLNLTSTSSCDAASVPAAQKVAFTFDARNRNTGTGFGDGSPSIGRSYTPDGFVAAVVSGGSTWNYAYNNRRLLGQETLSLPGGGGSWGAGRSYDANGHQSQQGYPDGSAVSFNPNALGEPTRAGAYASGVTYHPNGMVAGYTLGNGIVHTLTQNTRGLPSMNRDAGVVQDQYSYDANGNITAIADQQEGVGSRSLGYDGLDRLTVANASGVWGGASYGYDPLGNLRSSVVGARSSVHSYDASNRLININTNGAYTGYAYDTQGNVTGRGTQGFYFDQGNRMQLANGVGSYAYDGWGRRVMSYGSNGINIYQMYSQDGQLLMRQPVGGPANNGFTLYISLGAKTIAEYNSSSGISYSHTDVLGSPVARSNASGALISRTRYEPYGNTAAGTVPTGIGFTGHVNDAETGLAYMQQRYYDPLAARFLSVDPVTTDATSGKGFNLYEYVQSNPYRYTDPDGRESVGEFVDRKATESAAAGNRAATYGWSLAGTAWKAFGSEGISQIADKGSAASTGDKVSAGIELLGAVPGGKLLGEAATAAKGMLKADAVIAETLAGKGNLTSATRLSSGELLQAGEKFLGMV